MKIAFISRATLFTSPGGDTVQMLETAAALRKFNIIVDIYIATEQIEYAAYDLLHFFNITRPADFLCHIYVSQKPYVVSTIFLDQAETNKLTSQGIRHILYQLFSPDFVEYIKTIARWIFNGEKIVSKKYFFIGQRRAVHLVANNASYLLPNSENEYARLKKSFKKIIPYAVIVNGVKKEMVNEKYQLNEKYQDAVICMGRIEPRKNQLALIQALNNSKYKVFIHGKHSPNHKSYFNKCKIEAAANVSIEEPLRGEELFEAYFNAKVHVLPSYFETTGLSSLEAAAMGCNVVITDCGDTKEYFGDDAWYCEPYNRRSIKKAVDNAFESPSNKEFKAKLCALYTWDNAAEQTFEIYKKVLLMRSELPNPLPLSF